MGRGTREKIAFVEPRALSGPGYFCEKEASEPQRWNAGDTSRRYSNHGEFCVAITSATFVERPSRLLLLKGASEVHALQEREWSNASALPPLSEHFD